MAREIVSPRQISQSIHVLRGQKVMLDLDLAVLYGVATGHSNRAVRRNRDRFPSDFMFRLSSADMENLKCQIGISSWGGPRSLPYAFTEQGIAMLSSVLRSERAVKVNIGPAREIGFHVRETAPRYRTGRTTR